MSWKRGNASLPVEIANIQSWIETADPDLYGQNGDPGVIRAFHDSRAAQIQKDADFEDYLKKRENRYMLIGLLVAILNVLVIAFHK